MNRALLLLVPFIVTACSTGKENFATEPGQGFGWKSMQENHQLIQQSMGQTLETQKENILPLTVTPQPYLVQSGPLETIQRQPEQYLRIWFAPYQDAFGNLHEESAVHTVIQSGQWYVPNFSETGKVA